MFRSERTNMNLGTATRGRDPDHRRYTVEGCPGRESRLSLELNPRKRLSSAEEALCGSRPPPDGAGSVTISEAGHFEQRDLKGNLCKQCQMKVAELKRQALALADPGSLKVNSPGRAEGFFMFCPHSIRFPQLQEKGGIVLPSQAAHLRGRHRRLWPVLTNRNGSA
ncbi:hypothetical protein GJAV_G00012150 [Gymnothorax javanicus]|nr:hypothetical protein GJAV_G00012150 [Gymnothorax javanicus]